MSHQLATALVAITDHQLTLRTPCSDWDLAGLIDHGVGDLTGRRGPRVRLHDLIVHTWDIEQTLDPPASLPADLACWGLAKLSNQVSLTAKHFNLTAVPSAGVSKDAAVAYLSRFGQSSPQVRARHNDN